MTALFVLMLAMAAVFFVLGCLDQRKLYWKISAWQYRNPEANEPSDSALALHRFGWFATAVALLVFAGFMHAADDARDYSTAQVRSVAVAAASSLDEGTSSGPGSSYRMSSDVHDAVDEEGGDNVKIRSAGSGRYELTNRKGENPVCLTVTVDNELTLGGDEPWRHSVTTSVDEGPC